MCLLIVYAHVAEGSFSGSETPEAIRCDKTVHRHAFWRQLTDIIEDSLATYSKTCPKRPLKKKTKIGFQDRLSFNAGQKYCRMLQESILQYFRPSLSYHLSLRPLFCLFISGRLRQVLLYIVLMSVGSSSKVYMSASLFVCLFVCMSVFTHVAIFIKILTNTYVLQCMM